MTSWNNLFYINVVKLAVSVDVHVNGLFVRVLKYIMLSGTSCINLLLCSRWCFVARGGAGI